ncbi:hypothetical protein ACIRPT_03395 [Streptomyces sp. NPDC101227]|uniref:hypothetical protein n=1 Tax=Streptomyces sp. NPDC101227 TaxID=3366136 RepID=UPI0037FE80FA
MRRAAATVVLTTVCFALAACTAEPSGPGRASRPAAPTPAAPTSAAPMPAVPPRATAEPLGPEEKFTLRGGNGQASAPVPHLVGEGLRDAREAARAAGFRSVHTHDMLGRDRTPAADRNWKVCTQTPGVLGRANTAITIDLGVVKRDEGCFDDV